MEFQYDDWLCVSGPETAEAAAAFFGLPPETEAVCYETDPDGTKRWRVRSPVGGQIVQSGD